MMPANVSWRMVRLSVACLLAFSYSGDIAAQETGTPTGSPVTGSPVTGSPVTGSPVTGSPVTGSPTSNPTATVITPEIPAACYSNLTTLDVDVKADNPFIQKVYTLCPNTTFDVGFSKSSGECCFDGQRPFSPRSNSRFQCGEDGKSSNGCVLIGGESHILFVEAIADQPGVNIAFAGITFQDAQLVTFFLGNSGDMTFTDCIIREHVNQGVAFLAFFDAGAGRKLRETTGDHLADSFVIMKETLKEHAEGRFEEVEVPRDGDRSLQETLRMVVAFDGCLFEANVQAQFGDFRENGILSLLTAHNDLIVRNTIFQGNLFGDESTESDGFAITNKSNTSTVVVEDSCFIDNDFIGYGPVQLYGGSPYTLSGNAGAGNDDDLICQFVATSDDRRPLSSDAIECIDFDIDLEQGQLCPGQTRAPTSAPSTSAPSISNAPTAAPTTAAPTPVATLAPSDSPTSSALSTNKHVLTLALMAIAIPFTGLF